MSRSKMMCTKCQTVLLALVSLVGAAVGCTGLADDDEQVSTRPLFIDAPILEAEEVRTVGVLEGPDELTFGRIVDIAFGATGGILVLDGLSREVRMFREDGEFVGAIGGPGEGPGEFRNPVRVESFVDGVVVLDGGGRLVRFGSDGGFLKEYRLPPIPFRAVLPLRADQDDWMFAGVTAASTGMREIQAEIAVVLIDEAARVDTAAVGSSGDVFFRSPVGSLAMGSPICDGLHGAVSPGGYLFVADGSSGTVKSIAWTGELMEEWNVAPPASPPAEELARELRRRVPEPLDHPDGEFVIPALESRVCGLQVGGEEWVWIRFENHDGAEVWGALSLATGDAAGLVRFPPGVRVMDFYRNYAAAVTEDDLGVHRVVIYRLPQVPVG